MQDSETNPIADISYVIRKNVRDLYESFSVAGNYRSTKKNSIQWMECGIKVPDFNPIFDIENHRDSDLSAVHEAIAHYQTQKIPFLFLHYSGNSGPTFVEDLKSHGISLAGKVTLMSFDLNQSLPVNNKAGAVQITRVIDMATLKTFSSISDSAYGFNAGATLQYFQNMNCLFSPDSEIQLFVGYLNNQPVGITLLYLKPGLVAGNYWMGVTNEARQKGVATQMAIEMLSKAQEKGYTLAVAQCYDSSVLLADHIGSKQHGTMDVYASGS